MRIGLDGIPLASSKTGIGHYTLELARALAKVDQDDEFELISPFKFNSSSLDEDLPPNLKKVEARRRKFWWGVGLPLYLRRTKPSLSMARIMRFRFGASVRRFLVFTIYHCFYIPRHT